MLEYLDRYQDEDLGPQYAEREWTPGWMIRIRIDIQPKAFARPGFRLLSELVYDLLFFEKDRQLDLTQTPTFHLLILDQMGQTRYQTGYDAQWIKALPCLMQIAALNDAPGKKERTLTQISTSSSDESTASQQISKRYFNFSTPYRVLSENKALLLKSMQRVIDCLWQIQETECFGMINQIIFFDEPFFVLESWCLDPETGKLTVYHLSPG